MASNFSFDIVSEVNFMEVDNAITQAQKELSQRYDFKGSKSSIDYNKSDKKITLIGDDEFKLKALIDIVEGKFAKRGVPLKSMEFKAKEQAFEGTILKKRGSGVGKTITVRKIFQGVGVERVFPVYSPRIEKITVVRRGDVKRAKLYYLRERSGKATRIREKIEKK